MTLWSPERVYFVLLKKEVNLCRKTLKKSINLKMNCLGQKLL